ncbi:hypothetical protein ACJMK2_004583 [Sinanodonta woodiana]|uniref:Uncharacterized protein n=1 Tax=Sinanodonta woodiana TaxID=1069815 RepID=A0ABD3Y336_SINWO
MSESESIPRQSTSKPNSSPLANHEKYYHIRETEKRSSRKFRTTAYTYAAKFKDFKADVPLENTEWFTTEVWDSVLTSLKQQCQAKEDDRLRLSIHHDSLKSPVWIEFSSPSELTPSKVIETYLSAAKLVPHKETMSYLLTNRRLGTQMLHSNISDTTRRD